MSHCGTTLLWVVEKSHIWLFENYLSTFLTPLSYAPGHDIYYTFPCTLQENLISQHITGFSQIKSSRSAQRKDISVILLTFFLSKVILAPLPPGGEDLGQCLETVLIVTVKGIPLISWVEARDKAKHPTNVRDTPDSKDLSGPILYWKCIYIVIFLGFLTFK